VGCTRNPIIGCVQGATFETKLESKYISSNCVKREIREAVSVYLFEEQINKLKYLSSQTNRSVIDSVTEAISKKAKRLFEIPPFKQYAICDGIYNLLWGGKFLSSKELPVTQTPQLTLPFEISPF
jgi:hypothetical protein